MSISSLIKERIDTTTVKTLDTKPIKKKVDVSLLT